MRRYRYIFLLPAIAGGIFLLATIIGCGTSYLTSSISLQKVSFHSLPGWHQDRTIEQAFIAFKKSCPVLLNGNPNRTIGFGTKAKDWHPVCKHALKNQLKTDTETRAFFEEYFMPYKVRYGYKDKGIFTGYYESELRGSLKKTGKYIHPIHRPPKDLECPASDNQCGYRGIFGGLRPYYTREAIHKGALDRKSLEIIWVDDPVEIFFMHIQGSGRVILEDGRVVRLKYAGSNGHPFVPIGRVLLNSGHLNGKNMSMQSIRRWMSDNPDQAAILMSKNPRYIFFKEFFGEGPLGCIGVPLTPERSLAVDRAFIPMGAPIWLNTNYPENHFKMQRLLVTQDTGSSIKGPIRGDFFWGYGKDAMEKAGKTKLNGEYYIFLPR